MTTTVNIYAAFKHAGADYNPGNGQAIADDAAAVCIANRYGVLTNPPASADPQEHDLAASVLQAIGVDAAKQAAVAAAAGASGFIPFPLVGNPNAGARLLVLNGGTTDDCIQLGYNLSDALYTPKDTTEPQMWLGFEANYPNNPGRDPAFGTHPTCEIYFRWNQIGVSGGGSYVEPLFFGYDRTLHKIIRADMRAERITLGTTNDESNVNILETSSTTAEFFKYSTPSVGIGARIGGANLSLFADDPIFIISPSTTTQRSRIRFTNGGGSFEVGIEQSNGFGFFGADSTYGAGIIRTNGTQPILIGSGNPIGLKLMNGGDVIVGANSSALATNATKGLLFIPGTAGAPTGVPANYNGSTIAVCYDKTNHKIYAYDGAWRSTPALT